jgi:hypothetical protein
MKQQENLVLGTRNPRTFLYFLVSVALMLGGFWMVKDGDPGGWLVFGFFALCTLISLLQLTTSLSHLRLGQDGFTISVPLRSYSYRWSDIEEFSVSEIPEELKGFVVFRFSSSYGKQRVPRKLISTAFGYEGALPDTYGMSPQSLAELMNRWRTGSHTADIMHSGTVGQPRASLGSKLWTTVWTWAKKDIAYRIAIVAAGLLGFWLGTYSFDKGIESTRAAFLFWISSLVVITSVLLASATVLYLLSDRRKAALALRVAVWFFIFQVGATLLQRLFGEE